MHSLTSPFFYSYLVLLWSFLLSSSLFFLFLSYLSLVLYWLLSYCCLMVFPHGLYCHSSVLGHVSGLLVFRSRYGSHAQLTLPTLLYKITPFALGYSFLAILEFFCYIFLFFCTLSCFRLLFFYGTFLLPSTLDIQYSYLTQ